MEKTEVLSLIKLEYDFAKIKWPGFTTNRFQAISILTEEVGEAAQALNDSDIDNLKVELAQVAAVCVRFLETL